MRIASGAGAGFAAMAGGVAGPAPVKRTPQFQQNASPDHARAPQLGQNPAAAFVFEDSMRGAGIRTGADADEDAVFSVSARTFVAGANRGVSSPSSNTAPHSSQATASELARAPHDAHTNPRKSTPRFPKPKSRSHWKPSARFGSNTRLRLAVKSRFRLVENPSVRIRSKLRRFATAPPTPTLPIRPRPLKSCAGESRGNPAS